MSVAELPAGAQAFIEGLGRCGVEARVDHGAVLFGVMAFFGARAGSTVETAVSLGELGNWPLAPPHWVHFPDDVVISPSNTQASHIPGWTMHSRNLNGWGNAAEPAQAWTAHVRKVLEAAK